MTGTASTEEGIDVVVAEHGGFREIFATAQPDSQGDPASLLRRLQRILQDLKGEPLEFRVFGDLDGFASCSNVLTEFYHTTQWPLTWVQGGGCFGGGIAGIQVHAVAGAAVDSIRRDGRIVGRTFEGDFARYCILGDLHSSFPSAPSETQTQDTIEQMMGSLASGGMGIHDIVRTWFFIAHILDWYPAFNRVRSEIYEAEGVFDRYVPASTGIGGLNLHGAALLASALAIQPKGTDVTVRAIPSPLQCPALEYGSSFSRAAEVATPDCQSVLVSGTASIDPEGATAYLGDVGAQVRHTLEVVEAILNSRNLSFEDVTRGNAYFKDPTEAGKLDQHAHRMGLPLSRLVTSHNHVCREDLLFELEIEAVRTKEAQ